MLSCIALSYTDWTVSGAQAPSILQNALNGLSTFNGSGGTPTDATPPASPPTAAAERAQNGAVTSGVASNPPTRDGAAASPMAPRETDAASPDAVGTSAEQPLGFGVSEVAQSPADHEQYVHIGGRQMVGLYVSVWARKPVAENVSAWQVCIFVGLTSCPQHRGIR